MADVSLNTHNPFRTPAATPNPTGSSYAPPSDPHPTTQQQRYAPPSTPRPEADPTGLSEEAPPAYTAGPDVYQGESTLEYGPSRPFQRAPPPLQHPQGGYAPPPPPSQNAGWTPQQQVSSLWQQLTEQLTAASGSASYQQSHSPSQFPPVSWSAYPGGNTPLPQMQVQPPPQPPPSQPTTHVSDFARDFYATTSVPPGGFSDVSGARAAGSASGSEYPPPPPGPTRTPSQYRPPPGAPPPAARTPSPRASSAGGAGIPDDGRPTTTPMPGHPLLRDGQMLVYPPHHECSKCNNTGYKHADPTHPCSKCWSKYAKPYSGALVYAPGTAPTSPAPGSQHASSSFQRPLPRIYAPPPSSPSSQFSPPNSSFAPPPGPTPGSQVYAPPPPPSNGYPGNAHQTNAYPGNALGRQPTIVHTTGTMYPPPPHAPNANGYPPPATVYPPGDPRLGGAPCWRCSGRGTLSFLVFETVPCSVCRGVGRVFG